MEIKTKFNVGDIAWVKYADNHSHKIIVKEIRITVDRGIGIGTMEEDGATLISYKNEGLTDEDEDWFFEDSLYEDKETCDDDLMFQYTTECGVKK